MATKKPVKKSTAKSNVSKSAKKSSFQFKWWMAVIAVGVVAIIGVVVVRSSFASDGGGATTAAVGGSGITANYRGFDGTYDRYEQIIGGYVQPAQRYSNVGGGYFVSLDGSQTRCFHITPKGSFKGVTQVNMDEVPLGSCSG